jgi:hypothetical protein
VNQNPSDLIELATSAYDRLEMQETLSRYGWGFDEGDFEMLADTFTADATTSGTVSNSDQAWGPAQGVREIVGILKESRQKKTAQGRHTLHTFRFENQTATSADVYSYVLITSAQPDGMRISSAGWYRAAMIKEADGRWRMTDLTALLDSTYL